MREDHQIINGRDGLELFVHFWKTEDPKGLLCIIPGYSEHGGRFRHVAEFLTAKQITVMAIDSRGHGKSKGLRGHTPSLDHMLDDIEEALKLARSEYNEIPIFLLGQSMGGNLVLNYVLRKPTNELSGFVASSPWLQLAFEPPKWKLPEQFCVL